ncbi:MAG TPA: sugar transferase [Burkholderiaceae bacterium]|nr:sugar transferase [Burkholderiaceae bacterium]
MTLSVLMSVYKAENPAYLRIALESLKQQTRRADEVVLVEDGPLSDALHEVIEAFRDDLNIQSVVLPRNVGLAKALNAGLAHCRHELVARMDSDDISLPQRFEKQMAFMEAHPDIAASSASLEEFDENGQVFSSRVLPATHEELVQFARRRSPLSHAVAIFRKSVVLSVGGYPLFKRSQDVALWSLLIVKGYKLANLPDVLFRVRAGAAFMTRNGMRSLHHELAVIRYQRRIGFLTWSETLRNMGVRFVLASVPPGIKKELYAHKSAPGTLVYAMFKRLFDIIFAALGLLLASPLIALGWLAATLETRRNGFFLQERVGRYGQPFRIVKLRTMHDNPQLGTELGTVTTAKDPRITRSGAFLRRSKIDELPQLWNVLIGDMSFVGPRPDVPGYADRLQGEDRIILSVRPGITGPATVKYRNEEEILSRQSDAQAYNAEVIWPDKVRINREYIRQRSLWTDLRYLYRTFVH